MLDAIPIFIGYDPREAVAYHVCCQSIIERSSVPVSFRPLHLNLFKEYDEKHEDGSNAFIYSRFLIPWLMNWVGSAIFMDGDMIVKDDIVELWNQRDLYKAVQVVKHDYKTKYPIKYLGNKNEDYPRKNWSSVILWNCNNFRNRVLTPDTVAKSTGSYLHQFKWLEDDMIGDLPRDWNHLVREENEREVRLNHYTIDLPAFNEYNDGSKESSEWWNEYKKATRPV